MVFNGLCLKRVLVWPAVCVACFVRPSRLIHILFRDNFSFSVFRCSSSIALVPLSRQQIKWASTEMHSGVQSEVKRFPSFLPVLHLKARDFHYFSLSLSPLSPTLSLSLSPLSPTLSLYVSASLSFYFRLTCFLQRIFFTKDFTQRAQVKYWLNKSKPLSLVILILLW